MSGPFLDWSAFWARDRADHDWLVEPILARGRGHAIYARHKTGKSLLMLWLAAGLATVHDDVIVLYLDYEMGDEDLHERLSDMGYGPQSDLSRLRYALLPTLPPLDTASGSRELLRLLDEEQRLHPTHHVVVVIDTMGRAVAGDENSADTIRNFYRLTGLGLKQRGATWVRLDHEGKNPEQSQRGSSAKGDDVDVIWNLTATAADTGYILKRYAARMSWVPEHVALTRHEDPFSRLEIVAGAYHPKAPAVAAQLDDLGIDANLGIREQYRRYHEAGFSCRHEVVVSAVKYRRRVTVTNTRSVVRLPRRTRGNT